MSSRGSVSVPPPPAVDGKEAAIKKQRGKAQTKKACLSCRTHHLKCEGVIPCHQCIKRDLAGTCAFPAPRKRGPKSKELKLQVEQLQSELERQRAVIKQYEELLREKAASSGALSPRNPSSPGSPFSLPSPPMAEITPALMTSQMTLTNLSVLNSYVDNFMQFVFPHLPIVNPTLFHASSRNQLLQLVNQPPTSLNGRISALQVFAVLALGARTSGNAAHADFFMSRARNDVGDFFDTNNRTLASTLCLMSYYACGSGEGSKGTHYTALALQICKNLMETTTTVYRKCMITQALAEEGCHERHRMLVMSEQQDNVSMNERAFSMFIRVINDITLSLQVPDYEDLLKRVEMVQNDLDRASSAAAALAGGYRSQSPESGATYLVDCLLLCAARALLYDQIGLNSLAQQWADSTSNLVQQCDTRFLFLGVVMAVVTVARVHWQAGRMEMVMQDLSCLNSLAGLFPLAKMLYDKMLTDYGVSEERLAGFGSEAEPRHITALVNGNVSDVLISAIGASKCDIPEQLISERKNRQVAAKAKAQAWALGLADGIEEPLMDFLQPAGQSSQQKPSHRALQFSLDDMFLKNVDMTELFPEMGKQS